MKNVKLYLLLLGVGGLFLLYNCHSSKNMAKLNDVKWKLESLNGQKIQLSDPNSEMFILFENAESKVSGRAACNRFFGNYTMDGDKLKFSPMGATRMACPDLQRETEFFKMLEEVDSYMVKEATLLLNSQGKVVATFKKDDKK